MRLPVLAVVLSLALSWPASAARPHGPERVFMHACSQRNPIACIHRAALHRGVSFTYMVHVAGIETGHTFDPTVTNRKSGAAGLFQFIASTWGASWNKYRHHSPYSAKWASLAAALLMKIHGCHDWQCE